MKIQKMRAVAVSFMLALGAGSAIAASSYDPASNKLTLDSVVVDGVVYNNVVITLNSYSINSVGSSTPYTPVNATCAAENFTVEKFNAIQPNMTLEQVKQIIGCANDANLTAAVGSTYVRHGWRYSNPTTGASKLILVDFDGTGTIVTDRSGSGLYKARSGF